MNIDMDTISLIRCEWNVYNGFVLELIKIEYISKEWGFNGSLFGVNVSKEWLLIDFLFFHINVHSPITK